MPGDVRGALRRWCQGLFRVRIVVFILGALTLLSMRVGPGAQAQTPAVNREQGTGAPAATTPGNPACNCTRVETVQQAGGANESSLHWLYTQLFQALLLAFLLLAGLEIILQKAIPVAQRWNEFIDTCRRKAPAQAAPTAKTTEPAPSPAPKPREAASASAVVPELVGAETSR